MSLLDMPNLVELADKLLRHGPVRVLATPRRIRIQLGTAFVADTTRALFVWEHPYFPFYYVPLSAFLPGSTEVVERIHNNTASILRVRAGERSTDAVLAFSDKLVDDDPAGKLQALQGMVRVDFGAADAWFEEDVPIYVHPKDPFKRVDILPSTRPVRVLVDGHEVAKAASALHLHETGLPTRFYLPPTAVDPTALRRSETVTRCPYKGEAEYYDVVVGGKVHKDLVWYYRLPTHESAAIANCLCFYNEKVDIELDGEKLERPVTKFA